MSEDLLTNETHFSGFKGTLKTATVDPVDGSEIENIQAGDVYYDDSRQDFHIYDGSNWYETHATAS